MQIKMMPMIITRYRLLCTITISFTMLEMLFAYLIRCKTGILDTFRKLFLKGDGFDAFGEADQVIFVQKSREEKCRVVGKNP